MTPSLFESTVASVEAWANDGGPTPDKAAVWEVLELALLGIQDDQGLGELVAAVVADPSAALAPNVVAFDSRFKDPSFVLALEARLQREAVTHARAAWEASTKGERD